MVGEASSREGFMQQAELYLNNAKAVPFWQNEMFWIYALMGLIVIALIGLYFYRRRKKHE